MAAPIVRIDTSDPRPIWRQIEEGLAERVGSGALLAGDPVPSVRDLALALRVNPATVAKAYQRLVDEGVFESRRGDGTYVSSAPPTLGSTARRQRLIGAAARLANVATHLGADADEAHAALDQAFRRLDKRPKEGP